MDKCRLICVTLRSVALHCVPGVPFNEQTRFFIFHKNNNKRPSMQHAIQRNFFNSKRINDYNSPGLISRSGRHKELSKNENRIGK